MQRKTWYSIFGVDAMPLSSKNQLLKILLIGNSIWQQNPSKILIGISWFSSLEYVMIYYKMMNRKSYDIVFSSYLAFVDVLVCVVMVIFVLIAGCFTSVGFKVWCDEMEQRFPTCSKLTNIFPFIKFYGIGFE